MVQEGKNLVQTEQTPCPPIIFQQRVGDECLSWARELLVWQRVCHDRNADDDMGRYLTPAKVTLLVVALIYAEDLVPTSAATAVLTFLLNHITPTSKASETSPEGDTRTDHALPVSLFESTLAPHPSAWRPGRSLYDLLLRRLWTIDCSHALDAFITNLPCLLTKTREQILRERETGEESDQPHGRILRTSPLGAFIRRCHLEYARLQFQDSIALWQDFISYRLPTRQAFERKNPADARTGLDLNLAQMQLDSTHPLAQLMYGRLAENDQDHGSETFSIYDVEKLMEFQVAELQRLGGRLPDGMKTRLDQMAKSGAVIPKLGHYLSFLDSWRAGDFASALDNLHRYFDYAMQTRERAFYQYALLNLAILQADFGSYAEALPAMQEAIAVARENKDITCLNFCMSWVYHFGRSFPQEKKTIGNTGILGSEVEGLAFLKSRAKDAEMWSLLSTTLLSEAKLGLQYGDSLATVFENIAKASHLNIVKSAQSVTGPTLLMKGAAYSRVGLTHLAWWCGQAFLQCHAKDAPIEDLLKCNCRMAGLLVQRGRYNEATEMLDSLPPHVLRVLKFQNYLDFYAGLLKVRRFLHRHDLDAAQHLLERLRGQGVPEAEIGFTLSLLEIDLLMRRGDLTKALDTVEYVVQSIHQEVNDIAVQTRLMNLKARILAESGHALKGFSLVMRAAQIAYRGRILPSLWESVGILANILNDLQEFEAAADLLQSVLPQVLEFHDCEMAARSHAVLADSNMGIAGMEQDQSTKQKEFISRAMENIDHAYLQFRYIEELRGQMEMLKKKATIMHWRGDLTLANDIATQYLELEKQYRSQRV
ncbi:APC5 protein [Elasticomyces elasticus]|uniref:Anaphase-promoting complex subunit 5 n=1 Tax=Exophiala sideris TaxID=1016849 RepID=A0ABR0JSI2_9EURO|nr:APC5 protein [Elasticomyces elasticus]KAK5040386.1 APC5 protein [Exophiala sideris]KAK5068764.1 APC5 protein [Exophiala sideris]KAK5186362.1 APC5 protein [Eurotiomycetes sp. CCFEE 6388]